jgi:hypothetical protein
VVYFFVVCLWGIVNIGRFDELRRFIIFCSLGVRLFIIVSKKLRYFFDIICWTVSLFRLSNIGTFLTIKSGFIFGRFYVWTQGRMCCWTHSFINLFLSFQTFLQ